MICEAAFKLAEIDIQHADLTWEDVGWNSKPLRNLNILGQIPTLVLPDGEIITETNAILHWIHAQSPSVGLIQSISDATYVKFLRWLMFLNAAVYPTYTYGDVPTRWVGDNEQAADLLRKGTDNHRQTLFTYMEPNAGVPFFLGEVFCAIDLYLWMMCHWRPGKDWFQQACPKIHAIGSKVETIPEIIHVMNRNFPDE